MDWFNSLSEHSRAHILENLRMGKGNIYTISMLAAQYGHDDESIMQEINDAVVNRRIDVSEKPMGGGTNL